VGDFEVGASTTSQVGFLFFGFDPQEGRHLEISFDIVYFVSDHISVTINARLFIF
jgi:hypothetical protein